MLTISKALNAGQAHSYHAREFTSKEQNYWKQGDPALGEWQGRLASAYGLSGAVDGQHFARLAEGHHPQTDAQLLKTNAAKEYTDAEGKTVKAVEHRAGWDATFSAPKSVSLTALVGGDERVREAHRHAVTVALTELERYTQARIGGNHAPVTTGKFLAAKFEHDTARPVDGYAAPQLHTHAIILNLTELESGKARALQPQSFFDSQQYATAVYQSELTFQLRNLGYELTTGRSGAPEIAGYTQEYLDASSPRRQQIEEALAASGFSGPAAAQVVAHNSRDSKRILTPEEVLAAHREIAAHFGNQAAQVVAKAQGQEQRQAPDGLSQARQAVTYAKEKTFEREAVADDRQLMRDALRRGMGEVTYSQVRENFESRKATGEFQAVPGAKHATGERYTTRETIIAELENIRHMRHGQNAAEPMMTVIEAKTHAVQREFLNPAQVQAVEEVLSSRDRIHGLQGLAGTGKTTTLETIREGAERQGYAVAGFAPTSRAAGQLRDADIEAGTLQGFLAKGQPENAGKHLYMVDESSLASTAQMCEFLQRIGPEDRVLLIGDTRQHQGVDAGKPFEQMQAAGMQTSLLDKIMRQKDPELLQAVEHLSKNETKQGIGLLQQQGRITEIVSPAERVQAIAKDYALRPEGTLVVSPDNKSRQEINQAIRAELQTGGAVSKDSQTFQVLTQRSELTGADRKWALQYRPGDVLQYSKGSKEHGIVANSYATVVKTQSVENLITVRQDDGQQLTYDPKRLSGISAYRQIEREFAVGERIQFTGIDRQLGIANRDLATITKIEGTQIDVKMDGEKGRELTVDAARMRHIDHGYAVTSHSSQGLTADRVIVHMDTAVHPELLNSRFAYVSVSRASQDAKVYTDNAQQLGERLSSGVSKTSAVEPSQAYEVSRSPAAENAIQIAEQRRNPAIDQGIGF